MDVPPPFDLRCEYAVDPVGVDPDTRLRFTWLLHHPKRGARQKAYRVIVSSSRELAERGVGDVWDSGVVSSDENFAVYGGPPLESSREYYWRVMWWDQDGNMSPWSRVASFVTALRPGDWRAKWITGGKLLRREFELPAPVRKAFAHVTGLGYYELRINGRRVGDRVLDPLWTDYNKRVLYATYDVTDLLRPGGNAIGIMLGRGRYIKAYGYDEVLKAILQLEIELVDGRRIRVVTDESWRASDGPIVEDDVYGGEVYDATREQEGWDQPGFDDSGWRPVQTVDHPGRLVPSGPIPPIRRVGYLKARRVLNPAPGVYVFDFGQNMAGWARIRVRGPRGVRVQLRYAELIDERGNLDTRNLRGAKATDVYVLKGEGVEVYEPRFTYHGFRYVEVTGYPGVPSLDDVEAVVVHSDVEPAGGLATSCELVNDIHRIVLWSIKSNLMGVPTDCPQRDERMGWGGDAQLTAEAAMLNFWMPGFYEKWLEDWLDAQLEDGSVPDVVPPYWRLYPADPAWGEAYVVIPWLLYTFYGDRLVLERHYEGVRRWVEFLLAKAENYVLRFSKYGDWCPPRRIKALEIPGELVSTWVLYNDLRLLSQWAGELGKQDDARKYAELADRVAEAFNREFLRENRYYVSPGCQTCNALPLASGITPENLRGAVFEALVRDVEVEKDRHLDTGIVGTKYLLPVLSEYGRPDLAYAVATQTSYPSWGYMIREGATTLWERWELLKGGAMNSHNHHMFGTVDIYFYRYLAGVRPLKPGFREFAVKPDPVGPERVSASVRALTGSIQIELSRSQGVNVLKVHVPVGSSALIYVPTHGLRKPVVLESGRVVWRGGEPLELTEGVERAWAEGEYAVFKVGSGTYVFEARSTEL
ncbi:MAG: family 78 glycoside hydrolase catalytic domain [Thermofilaceae archaeon]